MALFESYERRINQINAALNKYGIASIEEAKACLLYTSAFPRLTGVHFSSHFSSGLGVSNLPAGILPLFARWPLLFPASPACIFLPVSPPA